MEACPDPIGGTVAAWVPMPRCKVVSLRINSYSSTRSVPLCGLNSHAARFFAPIRRPLQNCLQSSHLTPGNQITS